MPAPSLITDLSQTAASNSPSGSEAPSVLDDVQRAHASFIALLRDGKGHTNATTIASAATCDIGSKDSLFVDITGTTGISSLGTNYNGPRFCRFNGALTLTNGASLTLPGGANITTANGDWMIAIPNPSGTGWVVSFYQRAASAPNPAASGANNDITSMTGLTGGISGPNALTGAAAGMSVNNVLRINTGPLAGFRNRVINGNARVQQRAAGGTLAASMTLGKADRWYVYVQGGTGVSGSVNTAANTGFSSGVGFGATGASWTTGIFATQQRIESANVSDLNSQQITVSAKVYQDTGGSRNFGIQVLKANALDDFTTTTSLGTSSAQAVANATVTPISYTLTLGATDASNGLVVVIFDNAANTVVSKNYLVGDVQLEMGPVATPFEQRPFGLELALCQRYYSKSYTQGVTPGTASALGAVQLRAWASANLVTGTRFPVPMRIAPSVTPYSTNGPTTSRVRDATAASDLTVTGVNDVGDAGFGGFNFGSALTDTNVIQFHWTANAEL